MYDFITIGSALEDISFIINKPNSHGSALFNFFEDRKIEVQDSEFNLGGVGMNTAISLSKLGLAVAPIVRLGKDARGSSIQSELMRKGISTELVQVDSSKPTGVSVVLITKNKGRHVLFVSRGANDNLEIDLKKIKSFKPRWVYMTSFHGNWREDMQNVFDLKKDLGFKIALNPGQNQLDEDPDFIKSLLCDVDCVILNRREASMLTGSSSADIELLSKSINKMGAKLVVISEGVAGSNVYNGDTILHADIMKVDSMDTTGTGDVFGSTFVGSYYKFDQDIEKALKYAIVQSAKVTSEVGAQKGLIDLETIKKFASRIKITKINGK